MALVPGVAVFAVAINSTPDYGAGRWTPLPSDWRGGLAPSAFTCTPSGDRGACQGMAWDGRWSSDLGTWVR